MLDIWNTLVWVVTVDIPARVMLVLRWRKTQSTEVETRCEDGHADCAGGGVAVNQGGHRMDTHGDL